MKKVIQEATVKNAILFGGLQLFQKEQWRQNKKPQELKKLSLQMLEIMQLHLKTKNLVVGMPMTGYEVLLLEIEEKSEMICYHEIVKILESEEGQFVKIEPLAA
ncbi:MULTISPECIES: hypothetical protein [Enterococcus]|uniref:hypothetical protein n=1 Tax=Enterococcus TaxID=1350 RepID=UPI0010F5E802|nr:MULTISPECIES: hypothetical protein [Enterococcus]KAF1303959.1 hypothetical protein BAU16_02985 [Enterococcus sp. JM9B]